MSKDIVKFKDPVKGQANMLDIYFLDTDWKSMMLAGRATEEQIQAKSYFAQLALGNQQIMKMYELAENQNSMTEEISSLHESAIIAHKMIEENLRWNQIAVTESFAELMQQNEMHAEESLSLLSEMKEEISDGLSYVEYAIEESCKIISTELANVNAHFKNTNLVLNKIESVLLNQADTKVRELIRRVDELVREGMTNTDDWKYDNFNDALRIIEEAKNFSIGLTNPIIWLRYGYVLWQCNEKLKNDAEKKKMLIEAGDAFDKAARLFTKERKEYFTIALHNKANVQYLLGEYEKAENSIMLINPVMRSVGIKYDLARIMSAQNKISEMSSLLEECFIIKPFLSISIFGDPGFSDRHNVITSLINSLVHKYKDLSLHSSIEIKELVDRGSSSEKFGSANQHLMMACCSNIIAQKQSFPVIKFMYDKMVGLQSELSAEFNLYDYAVICTAWGKYEKAKSILERLVGGDRSTLAKAMVDTRLKPIMSLISPTIDRETAIIKAEIEKYEKLFLETSRLYMRNHTMYGLSIRTTELYGKYVQLFKMTKNDDFAACFDRLSIFQLSTRAIFTEEEALLLEKGKAEIRLFSWSKNGEFDNESLYSLVFSNILLYAKVAPKHLSATILHLMSFYSAIYEHNAGRKSLEMRIDSENGLGTYVAILYEGIKGTYSDKIFIPNEIKNGFFGKSYLKYTLGNRIPFKYAVPSIVDCLDNEYMKKVVLKLKDSKLFS